MKKAVTAVLTATAVATPAAAAFAQAQHSASASVAAAPKKATTKTYTGPSVDMRWGPVQVSIVVSGQKILDVKAVAPIERPRSAYINQQALPMLRSQVLKQQGIKNVYAISGATMTSEAYGQSLQAALQAAHINR